MTTAVSGRIDIEVAYADAGRPIVRRYALASGATVADALQALGRDWRAEEWIDGRRDVGIFGCVVGRDRVLTNGDRVELYEPLLNDPKVARRQRARLAAGRR